jgi:hypothetical protein
MAVVTVLKFIFLTGARVISSQDWPSQRWIRSVW